MRKFWLIAVIILILAGLYFFLGNKIGNRGNDSELMDRSGGNITPIVANNYGDKIVYDTANARTPAPFIKDCSARGGVFKECGNPCPSDAEACVAVCVYTCEDIAKP